MREERIVRHQQERADELAARVRRFVAPRGDERVVDVGTGAGALAFALAPLVREVVGVDPDAERLELARRHAPENVTFVEGDAMSLPFERGEFDLAATARTLHHLRRPELAVAELARVTRRSARILVIDQLGVVDPLVAFELDRFERARDPSHNRLLPDGDLRAMFEMNGLVLIESEVVREKREVDEYLDLAGCEGDERERAERLAPGDESIAIGWYLLRR